MVTVEDILTQYTDLRSQGIQPNVAHNFVSQFVETLDEDTRQFFYDTVDDWEGSKTNLNLNESPYLTQDLGSTLVCEQCGKPNAHDAAYCYSCGTLMPHVKREFTTRQLGRAERERLGARCFQADSVLVLKASTGNREVNLQPQSAPQELILGRVTTTGNAIPDVDLTPFEGDRLGVSRMHAAIAYQPNEYAILVCDLNSSNGTFVNGQKLRPEEFRILQHGDALCLGRLVLYVKFQHD